ncbi:Ger(x)C family spore germination protein [Cohnella zeiphila]|uniref:Ger(X)C family spore germination protein n=1 Tax=Cohnella zeiphila TaxID=2761120 RepID=A0A7X0SS71_9BACL|nr:Ger(x)C family spore germination protein [Cohnella zeiphila]MBB6734996.1 Ger(x)C family spore germination protein [Cohnella zeiphila]
MKGKRLLVLLTLLLAGSALGGCGFKDIDKRFFVVAMSVDPSGKEDKKYLVTVKLAIPSPSEKFGSNQYTLVSEDTDSIAQAVRIIKSKVDKELDLGHLKAIVIGRELVEKGNMDEVMDWFVRRRDIQNIAWVAAGVPDGRSILDLRPPTERLPSNMLFMSFGQVGTETAYIVSEYLFDFRRRLRERGLDPILPIVESRGDQQVAINKVALLDKNKMRLVLDPLDTKIFNSFYQGIGKYDIQIRQDQGYFIISADNVKGSFTIENVQGKTVITLKPHIHGIIEEATSPISKTELAKYERQAEQEIKERALQFVKRLQQANIDPIGFGLRYRARHPGNPDHVWKKWVELYPEVEFRVQPHVRLTSTGQLG